MDESIKLVGQFQAGPVHFLEEDKKVKQEEDKKPQPQKSVDASSWCEDFKKSFREEFVEQRGKNIVKGANQEISAIYSWDLLKNVVEKKLMAEPDKSLVFEMLPTIQKTMEEVAYGHELDIWSLHKQAIDKRVSAGEARLPPPFSSSMINQSVESGGTKEIFFPADRCPTDENGRYYDVWVSKWLGRRVYYEPYLKWLEALDEVYHKIYLVEFEKDKQRANPPVIAKVEVRPEPQIEPPNAAMREFFQEAENELLPPGGDQSLRGKIARLRGGR